MLGWLISQVSAYTCDWGFEYGPTGPAGLVHAMMKAQSCIDPGCQAEL